MEPITRDRLYENFDSVMEQIDDIVARRDIAQAQEALNQIRTLVESEEHIRLDDGEPNREGTDIPYDHVLHRLLDVIHGEITTASRIEEDEELRMLISRRREIDVEIHDIDEQLAQLGPDGFTVINEIEVEEINALLVRITENIRRRRNSLNRTSLRPETRQRIEAEINQLTVYLHELEVYAAGRGVDVSYIDREIARLERDIRRKERRIEELGGDTTASRLDEEIARLEAEETRLGNQAEEISVELQAAIERGEDTTEIQDRLAGVSAEMAPISARLGELRNIKGQKRAVAILERDETQLVEALETERDPRIRDEFESDLRKVRAELGEKRAFLEGTENRERLESLATTIASYDADIEELESRFPGLAEQETLRLEQLRREREELVQEQEQRRLRQELLEQYGQDREPNTEEIAALRESIEEDRTRITELQERRANLQGERSEVNISEVEVLINILEIRIHVLEEQRNAARRSGRRQEVERIEREIEIIQARITRIRETQTLIGQDNTELRNDLNRRKEALITESEEVDIRIQQKRRELLVPGQHLDLREQAREIGDHIFKAADIRQELLDRGYTREDFLRFYTAGRENATAEMERISHEIEQVQHDVSIITTDESGVNLDQQLREAGEDETRKREILERIRQKIQNASPELAALLTEAGFTNDLTSASVEDVSRFETFYHEVVNETNSRLTGLQREFEEHRENVEVFNREIERINRERETIAEARDFIQHGEENLEEEKALRERQIRATIFGDEEIAEEWNTRIDRFLQHRGTKTVSITGPDGQNHDVEIKTINDENYPEFKDDAHFLDLENYKKFLETTSLYDTVREQFDEATALSAVKANLNLDSAEFDEYNQLVAAGRQEDADNWLKTYIDEQKDYVKSYHGFANKHAVRYATLRTAGSTLEGMLPVRGELPTTTKLKNALTNTGRFLMLRWPHFTRTNSKGETVPNVLGGVTTLGLDGLVVGGAIAATVAAGPAGLIPFGVYYAAKGIVTVGNVIAARREYNRNQSEIDDNVPRINKPTAREKEVMRREYYRDVEHYSRPRAWLRGKIDKYFRRQRGQETDEQIAKRTNARMTASLDENSRRKADVLIENVNRSDENQRVRVENTRKETRSASTYNDIVQDPDSVDLDVAAERIAQNAAVQSARPGATRRNVNQNDSITRSDKYTREEAQYEQTQDIKSTEIPVGTASVSGITVDQKHRAAMERQDAINRVLTIILSAAGNLGIQALRNKLTVTKYREEQGEDQILHKQRKEARYRDETRMEDDVQPVTRTEVDKTSTFDDLQVSDQNFTNTYRAPNGNPSSVGGSDRVDGIAVRIRDANGNGVEWSAGEPGSGILAGRHVHGTFSGDISGKPIYDALSDLRTADPAGYAAYCKATGIDPNNFDAVAQSVLENNHMWLQSSNMEGWSQALGGGLRQVTENVVVGQRPVTVSVFDHWEYIPYDVTIPGKTIKIPYEVVSGSKILDATLQGAVIGAAGTGIDALHEAARPTDKTLRGNAEELTPNSPFSRVALAMQEEFDRTVDRRAPREEETPDREDHGDDGRHEDGDDGRHEDGGEGR